MNPQGTYEWYAQRWGMITMSERVKTLLEGHVHTLNRLLKKIRSERDNATERTIRAAYESESSMGDRVEAMAWGRKHEVESIEQYELTRNVTVIRPGFTKHYDYPDLVGSSIDFIETDDGTPDGRLQYACEIKCPHLSENHLKTIRYGMGPEHYNQTQGHMEVLNLDEGKFVSYDPRHPVEEQRVYVQNIQRDPEWMRHFRDMIEQFAEHLANGTQFEHKMKGATDGIPSMF